MKGIEQTGRAKQFDIPKENLCDNCKGSALLFCGSLRMKSFVGKYAQHDGACGVCGKEADTFRHMVSGCCGMHSIPCVGNICLPEALGFKVNTGKVKCKFSGGDNWNAGGGYAEGRI